jgi:hypothetical protein
LPPSPFDMAAAALERMGFERQDPYPNGIVEFRLFDPIRIFLTLDDNPYTTWDDIVQAIGFHDVDLGDFMKALLAEYGGQPSP